MPYIFKKYYPGRNIAFFVGEGLLIFISINLTYLISRNTDIYLSTLPLCFLRSLLVTVTFQLSLYYLDLYDLKEGLPLTETTSRVIQAFGIGCIALAGMYYFLPLSIIPSRVFFPAFFAVCCSIFLWRFAYDQVLGKKLFAKNTLLLGSGELAEMITTELMSKRDSGFNIRCIASNLAPSFNYPSDTAYIPSIDNLLQHCKKYKIEMIVVALDERRGTKPVFQLLDCKINGIVIENAITFYEKLSGKILVEKTSPEWFIFSKGFAKGRFFLSFKRFLDVCISLSGLIISLPISLLCSIIIKLESPGPIIYKQVRVGEGGKTFQIYKFRSMRNDAEKGAPVWAKVNDPRVTKYGNFIRKVRFDEIPQMWNVLKGEMSFVGPRPERPQFVEQLAKKIPYYSLRHTIKPGITGWAQICYPYGASENDALHKLEYDLYYIKYLSLQMDFWVLFQTIKTILFQKGAR